MFKNPFCVFVCVCICELPVTADGGSVCEAEIVTAHFLLNKQPEDSPGHSGVVYECVLVCLQACACVHVFAHMPLQQLVWFIST